MTKKELGLFLGASVKARRLECKVSERELARKAGLPLTPVQHLLRGNSTQVSVYTLDAVAVALDTTIDRLMGKGRG